jgi:hypothetical protein
METASKIARRSSASARHAGSHDACSTMDPRDYFRAATRLGDVGPEITGPMLLQVANYLIRSRGRPITILHVGCSYGVLSAVTRFGLSVDELRGRYAKPMLQTLSFDDLTRYDAHYFASWPRRDDLRFVGLDRSPKTIAFTQRTGLIDEGLIVDLEANSLSERAKSIISTVDLIVWTGAAGCISEKTFAKILGVFPLGNAPWIASFVLRPFDYGRIADTARQHGLATERLNVTFAQPGFENKPEAKTLMPLLGERGIESTDEEYGADYQAELFVSRPTVDAQRTNLREIIAPASESNLN